MRHRVSALVPVLVAGLLLSTAEASAAQVPPPGPTGCGDGLTKSDQDPRARLPATAVFRSGEVRVRMLVGHPTQTTRVTLRAFLPGGRRADAFPPGGYTCTSPGRQNTVAFPVKPGLVGGLIRRHGKVRLRVSFQMVNANGRSTTLRRVVTVGREPRSAGS